MEKQATSDRSHKGKAIAVSGRTDMVKVPYAGTFIHLRRLRPHQKPGTSRELVTMTLTDDRGYPILPAAWSMGDGMIDEIASLYQATFGDVR